MSKPSSSAMKKIIVASTNPVKINATSEAFKSVFPDQEFEVKGLSAASEVADQPMSENETFTGAINRAVNVSTQEDADYWVGIEGGIEVRGDDMEAFAWVVIKSANRKIGKGRTGTFIVPKKMQILIEQGKELGEAVDLVFQGSNLKQKEGTIGKLTGNAITRTSYYKDAVVFALVPFLHPELY